MLVLTNKILINFKRKNNWLKENIQWIYQKTKLKKINNQD